MAKKKMGKLLSMKKEVLKRYRAAFKKLSPKEQEEFMEKLKEAGRKKFPGIKYPDEK